MICPVCKQFTETGCFNPECVERRAIREVMSKRAQPDDEVVQMLESWLEEEPTEEGEENLRQLMQDLEEFKL